MTLDYHYQWSATDWRWGLLVGWYRQRPIVGLFLGPLFVMLSRTR